MLKQRKKGIENIENRFNNMSRIFPCEDEESIDMYESVKELRLFFL